jgi:hypothetical protein
MQEIDTNEIAFLVTRLRTRRESSWIGLPVQPKAAKASLPLGRDTKMRVGGQPCAQPLCKCHLIGTLHRNRVQYDFMFCDN